MQPNRDFIYEATSKLEQLINTPMELTNGEQDYNISSDKIIHPC